MAELEEFDAPRFQVLTPSGPLYRIARLPDPWAWRDWAHAGIDGTFGSRWDDPQAIYRVLYASSQRLGAFVEVLARFRPDPHITEALAEIEDDSNDDGPAPGELDIAWLKRRGVGVARVKGAFLDVGHSASLAALRKAAPLMATLSRYPLDDFDAAAIRLSVPRRLTQDISRYVFEQSTRSQARRFSGIAYASRLGDEFQNWAIFEAPDAGIPQGTKLEPERLGRDDPDLRRALSLLGIRLITPAR